MLSLIPETGIKLIITIIAGTGPRPWPITDLIINTEPDRQIVHPQVHLTVPLQGHPIVHPQEHPIAHPQEHLIDPLHQMFLQEEAVPGVVVEVIVEVVVVE